MYHCMILFEFYNMFKSMPNIDKIAYLVESNIAAQMFVSCHAVHLCI